MDRNVEMIVDNAGNKVVKINDIRFKGKRSVNWKEVRNYLEKYVGEIYEIADSTDVIYIGTDFPSEYAGSRYTHKLQGSVAKAKANASQGIPEIYDSRFALPIFTESGKIERYNVFRATMLIRHSADGKMYLYDILDIKKETGNSLG